MKKETYEQAAELVNVIRYDRWTISILETMLDKFDDPHTAIDVICKDGPGSTRLSLRQYELPELREALQKARNRFKAELKENKEKLERLHLI